MEAFGEGGTSRSAVTSDMRQCVNRGGAIPPGKNIFCAFACSPSISARNLQNHKYSFFTMSDAPNTPQISSPSSPPSAAKEGATIRTNGLDLSNLGKLPTGYGQMFLIARDPHWLFTYWDFDYSSLPSQRQLAIEVYQGAELEKTIAAAKRRARQRDKKGDQP